MQMSQLSQETTTTNPCPDDTNLAYYTGLIQEMLKDFPIQTPVLTNNPNVSTSQPDASNLVRLRLHLIRHRFARFTELSTLKLFKSFVSTLKKAGSNMVIFPIDSTKQQYTSLSTNKQRELLSQPQLRLYFVSWYREQHYSLSGFIHIHTLYYFNDLCQLQVIMEWLDSYQYSLKLCKSQEEEMFIIGVLCYGSLFIYREDLLTHLIQHPTWQTLNANRPKPIIIDLVLQPFRGSNKSIDMIFVRAERSKKAEARQVIQEIYDGPPKAYPCGDILLFIPVTSKLEEDYTPDQRDKFIFNHEKFLGEEDCTAIFGLKDLNSNLSLHGKNISLWTLLKCIPALNGMSKPRLFQVVDPNSTHQCTIVTFQKCDRPYILSLQDKSGQMLSSLVGPDQIQVIFQDVNTGIRFADANAKSKGKYIKVQETSQEQTEFLNRTNALLSSPPKKRAITQPITTTNRNYSGVIQFISL